jgi:hypothetical protein
VNQNANQMGGEASMDTVLRAFLERQFVDGMALAAASDLLDLVPIEFPVEDGPPVRYLAKFSCTGLRMIDGAVREANEFVVGITFTPDHLVTVDPMRVITWVAPDDFHHPNVGRGPLRSHGPLTICVGNVWPGVSLVDLLYQTFEVITYHKVTMTESDALNWEACQWARWNADRFPVDRRPLKRASRGLEIYEVEPGDAAGGQPGGGA